MKFKILAGVVAVTVLGLLPEARGYDYSEPMACFPGLPLGFPEKPFVLRFSEEELLSQPIWTRQVDGIVVQAGASSPIRVGAEALQGTLGKLFARDVPIIEVSPKQETWPEGLAGEWFIVLGVPDDFALAAGLAREAQLDVSDASLNGDGFCIKPMKTGAAQVLFVTSPVSRGVMYGAYELEERTTSRGVPNLDQKTAPRMRYRGWPIHNHEVPTPRGASGRWRYNMSPEYDAFWPFILPFKDYPELGAAEHREEIEKQQAKLHALFADMTKYGSMPTIFFNFMSLQWAPNGADAARAALAAKYPGILAQPPEKYRYSMCPSHPEMRKLVAYEIREMLQTFPEIEMVMLQMCDEGGEIYCDCAECQKTPYIEKLLYFIDLMISTAREVNPKVHIMVFGSGITNNMARYDQKLAQDPTSGLSVIDQRLGAKTDGFVLMATTPPGGDVEGWLAPDSTALGQGLRLYYLFHWYEAGGPGIAAPISPVMSHLSWALPVCLNKLKTYGAPGSGMIGGASPVAGMEVAWWYPDLDPQKFMRNWCRAKYGKEAGDLTYEALVGTHKITEAFWVETEGHVSESFDLYRWDKAYVPWAVNMDPLTTVGLGQDDTKQTTLASIATLGFNMCQAAQPEGYRVLKPGDMEKWLRQFDLSEETATGDRAEAKLAQALALMPGDAELQRLYGLARATKALIHLYKDYNLALVYASASRNAPEATEKTRLVDLSRNHLKEASRNVAVYVQSMLPITQKEKLVRLKRDTDMFYVSAATCIVREAAFLFDKEFGGESVLRFLDQTLGVANEAGSPGNGGTKTPDSPA